MGRPRCVSGLTFSFSSRCSRSCWSARRLPSVLARDSARRTRPAPSPRPVGLDASPERANGPVQRGRRLLGVPHVPGCVAASAVSWKSLTDLSMQAGPRYRRLRPAKELYRSSQTSTWLHVRPLHALPSLCADDALAQPTSFSAPSSASEEAEKANSASTTGKSTLIRLRSQAPLRAKVSSLPRTLQPSQTDQRAERQPRNSRTRRTRTFGSRKQWSRFRRSCPVVRSTGIATVRRLSRRLLLPNGCLRFRAKWSWFFRPRSLTLVRSLPAVIHAVESRHGGKADSSVLYIPAAPLTKQNATYLAAQRARFEAGKPAPDFPGGAGESQFVARAGKGDVHAGSREAGLRALGYAPFVPQKGETEGGKRVIEEANSILGFA